MTTRSPNEWLREVVESAEELRRTVDAGRGGWDADPKSRRATYWLACVVGEACKGYATSAGLPPGTQPWSAFARLRDKLIHGYWHLDDDELWRTLTLRVPALLSTARAPLDMSGGGIPPTVELRADDDENYFLTGEQWDADDT